MDLIIQDKTLDALHDLKITADVRMDRAVSFLLDAGAIMYQSIKEQMMKKLR